MARARALFAVEARGQWTVGHQRDTVIGGSTQPRLHRRRDVHQDVLVLVFRGERDARGNGGSERWRVAGIDRALGPCAIDVVNVEAARGGYSVDIEFESGLGDVGAGVAGGNRRQIELNERRLRTFDIEQRLGAVVRGGGSGVGV